MNVPSPSTVHEYCDPDEKAIVMVMRAGGGISSYLIGARPRPSEAQAVRKAKED